MIAAALPAPGHAAPHLLSQLPASRGPRVATVRGGAAVWSWDFPGVDHDVGRCRALIGQARLGHRSLTPADDLDGPSGAPYRAMLRGAFALVAAIEGGLLLARGPFGGQPLYFTRLAEGVVACSRLEALAALLPRRAPDAETICGLFAPLGYGPNAKGTRTAYDGIHRVRSGEVLVVDLSGETASARSTLRAIEPPRSVEEAADELRRRFERAIERATTGATRVAVSVSGGLDSSGILACAVARARGANAREVCALSLDFAAHGDDRPFLKDLAAALGLVPVRLRPADGRPYVRSGLVLDGAPGVAWQTGFHETIARRARDEGADRILTGELGDVVSNGPSDYFARIAARGHIVEAVRAAVQHDAVRGRTPTARRVGTLVFQPLASRAVPHGLRLARARRTLLRAMPWAGPRLRAYIHRCPIPLPAHLGTDLARYQGYAHAFADFAEFYAGVGVRAGCIHAHPFGDEDVVELMASVPAEYHFCDGLPRGLFRLAMRNILPETVRRRGTKGHFEPAFEEMIAPTATATLSDLMTPIALADLGIVEPTAFRTHAERVFAPTGSRLASKIWPWLAAEAFLRTEVGYSGPSRNPARLSRPSPAGEPSPQDATTATGDGLSVAVP